MKRPGFAGSFWPTEEQEQLLRAALLEGGESERSWQAVRPTLDIDRLDAGAARLLPLVYLKLVERGSDDPLLPRMKGLYRYLWSRNQLNIDAVADMLRTLHRNGIETLLLGSTALIHRYYSQQGTRLLDEPAVLVRLDHRTAALAALDRAGWHVAPFGSGRYRQVARNGRQCGLCWRLPPELEHPAGEGSADEFWNAAVHMTLGETPTSALCATDELIHTCLAAAGSSRTANVLWVADATVILQAARAELDWVRLIRLSVEHRCAMRLHDALRYLADGLDAPVPTSVIAELEGAPVSSRERFAHRMTGRGTSLLGNASRTFAIHMVSTPDASVFRTCATFPSYLAASWGVDHIGQLPGAFARRFVASVTAWRGRARARS